MIRHSRFDPGTLLALGALVGLATASTLAEESPPSADPLAPFERLIGGRWTLGDSYQTFEWGVGRKMVVARGYFLVEGEPKLVSEGFWYWHPGKTAVEGYHVGTDMPVELFVYDTKFRGDKMISELVTFARDGSETRHREIWEFTDEDHYVWTLYAETPDGLQESMSGVFTRQRD